MSRFDLTPFGLTPKDLFPSAVYSASGRLLPQVREYVAWRGGQGLTIEGAVGATRVVLRFFKNERGEVAFVSLCSSCKQVERCVHSAALLTVAHSKRIEIVSESSPKKEAPRLSPVLEGWLSRLKTPRVFAEEELRFVITCDPTNAPTLTLYSRGEPLPVSKALRQWDAAPKSVSTPLRLTAGLLGKDELHRTEVRLDKPGGGVLLAAAVQSGLAHWGGVEGERVNWSTSTRECSLGWQVLSEKGQIPTVRSDASDSVIFRCTPPLYIDLTRLEVGPCQHEVQEELLDEWLSGKEISSDEIESIVEFLTPLKLPPPKKVIQETVNIKPELALSLEGGRFSSYRPEGGKANIAYLKVSFRYQGFEVQASHQKQVVEFGKDTKWIKIARDGAYEKQLIAKLISFGFVKTKVLYPNVDLGPAADSFTLDGGPLRWHSVMQALRAANIHLTIRPSFPLSVTELRDLHWHQEMSQGEARVSVSGDETDVLELLLIGEVVEKGSDGRWVIKSKEGALYLVPRAAEISSYLPELFSQSTKLLDGWLVLPAVRANEITRCLDDAWHVTGQQPRLLLDPLVSRPLRKIWRLSSSNDLTRLAR